MQGWTDSKRWISFRISAESFSFDWWVVEEEVAVVAVVEEELTLWGLIPALELLAGVEESTMLAGC